MIFGHAITAQQLFGQLLIGLINGSFYALLSLGLAVIFGMLNIVNFAHGALYMMGAFGAYFLLHDARSQLLVGADRRAADRRRLRRAARAHAARPPARARSALQPAADLRPGAGHRGAVPELFRRFGHALRDPAATRRRAQPRLHVPAQLSRLGDRLLRLRLFRDLVPDREDAARRLSARRDREPDDDARLRPQRAAHDHADLRLRRRPRRARRRARRADQPGAAGHGRRTSSPSSSPSW